MRSGSRAGLAQELFAGLPARYDRLGALLSFGQDRRWRRRMIEAALVGDPARIIDVATGPAGVALDLARRTDAHVIGVDLSAEMLARGRANVAAADLADRIALVRGQGERLPLPDACADSVTFTYLLRYVDRPAETVAELARVLRPGGVLAGLEFAVPPNPFWRGWWLLYTRLVLPVAGGMLGGRAWWRVGRFLGPSISEHERRFPVEVAIDSWTAAGLVDVRIRRMSLGGGLVMWGRRPPDSGAS